MSTAAQTPPPKGGRNKQRQPKASPPAQPQFETRPLEPYFDDSVAGDAIQTHQNDPSKVKAKAKPARKKQTTPAKPKPRKNGLEPPPAKPAEIGYHSESGTAHYLADSRSRSASAAGLNAYPTGGIHSASTSQPVLPSDAHDSGNPPNGTPAKQVYAGPNFLASPAASTLPMPKGFSKPTPPLPSPPESHATPARDQRASSTPLKQVDSDPLRGAREGSPLDFLFHADKAERLRQNDASASPLSAARPSSNSLRPTPLRDSRSRSNGASPSRKDVLLQEMDGTGEHSDSPDSDETPSSANYRQRINALRSGGQGVPEEPKSPVRPPMSPTQSQTEALKQMLFANQNRQAPGPLPQPSPSPSRNRKAISIDMSNNHGYPQYGPLSPLRSPTSHMPSQQPRPIPPPRHVSQEQRPPSTGNPPADIKTMEDSLRKFLKIG